MSMYGEFITQVDCSEDEDMTKQSMKDECDINNILAQYAKTGLLTPVTQTPGSFVDVSEVGDYREAIHNVREADRLFMQLPSAVRTRFENDPAQFLDFATEESNMDELREMGLLPPLPIEEPSAPETPPGAPPP